MEKIKKIPQRKCVGCGIRRDKGDLYRVVKSPEGNVCLDKTGRMAGRGAYICNDVKCLKLARKARRLETNLETIVSDEVFMALEEAIGTNE